MRILGTRACAPVTTVADRADAPKKGLWWRRGRRYRARTPTNERSVSTMNPMTIIPVTAPFRVGVLAS